MSASIFFHRNVLLLTQVIPPSSDFKIYFHEGMFDKPNTVGFMHVSQYLLTIYDAERFRKLVQWPVICKKTEVKYRNDVKDYLNVIASENPDVDFPPIFASYLVCATGTKFTTIMWKLSIIVLRTYIKRNCNQNIFYVPYPNPADELIRATLQRINKDTISNFMSHRRNMKEIREKSKIIIEEEEEALANIKRELFEKKESILHLMSKAPVDSSIKERLTNIEDIQIIQFWRQNIIETVTYIKKGNMTFKNMETLSNRITNMISSRISGTKILDAEQLTRVNSSSILLLPSSTNVQYLHNLYINDKLVLFNFIKLFHLLLCQIYQCLRNNKLKDLSECFLQIEASQEDMKSGIKVFQDLITSIASTLTNLKFDLCQKKMNQTYQENISPVKDAILCPSPIIQINTNCCNEGNDIPKRLELTPIEGAHKSLFSRYERQYGNNKIPISELRTNLLVSRINFDDTISLNINEKIPQHRMYKSKLNSSNVKHAGILTKYSRLFSSPTTKSTEKGNCNMSTLHSSKANSTAIMNAVGDIHNVSQFSLGNTKSLFDFTKEVIAPEKLITISNLRSQSIYKEVNGIHNHQCKKDNETEEGSTVSTKDDKSNHVKDKTKRRSISDLVQRYKRIL